MDASENFRLLLYRVEPGRGWTNVGTSGGVDSYKLQDILNWKLEITGNGQT
jgi:hypothetical protein